MEIKEQLVTDALKIVTGARRSAYGKPEQNFERICRLWNAHNDNIDLQGRSADGKTGHLVPGDVALYMILMKVARLAETPDHRDSVLDILGYTLCYGEIELAGLVNLDEPVAEALTAKEECRDCADTGEYYGNLNLPCHCGAGESFVPRKEIAEAPDFSVPERPLAAYEVYQSEKARLAGEALVAAAHQGRGFTDRVLDDVRNAMCCDGAPASCDTRAPWERAAVGDYVLVHDRCDDERVRNRWFPVVSVSDTVPIKRIAVETPERSYYWLLNEDVAQVVDAEQYATEHAVAALASA